MDFTPKECREAAELYLNTEQVTVNAKGLSDLAKAHADKIEECERLREALEEIREVWAGSEAGEPVHAQEAYAIHLCKQQYKLACAAIKEPQ